MNPLRLSSFGHVARFRVTASHAASAVAVAASLYFSLSQMQNDQRRLRRDLDLSAALLADSLAVSVEPALETPSADRLETLVRQFGKRGRLAGIAVYDAHGGLVTASPTIRARLERRPAAVADCLSRSAASAGYEDIGGETLHVNAVPLKSREKFSGVLAVLHRTAYIDARSARTRWSNAQRMAIQAALFVAAVWVFGLLLSPQSDPSNASDQRSS